MLRRGGSVVDAAIATQLVLNLVEPQSSGIGGGAFMVVYSAKDRAIVTYDSRETAPAAARPDRFLDADGKPLPFAQAVNNGMAVGVPGLLRGLEMAHQRQGKAAVGRPVPARDPAGRAGFRRVAAPAQAAGGQQGIAAPAGRRGLFLRARW